MPAEWIAEATARQTSNGSSPTSDWEQGYGYQFWRCRHGLYRGDGAFGQFCIVMPEQDAVVAITSGTRDLHGVMNLVWEHILPALQAKPLPADKAGRDDAAAASSRACRCRRRPARRRSRSPPQVSGKRYVFAANDAKLESITVEFGADGVGDPRAAGRPRHPHPGGDARGSAASPCSRSASRRRSPAPAPGPRTTPSPRSSRPTRPRSSRRSRCSGRAKSCSSTPSTTWPSASASARGSSASWSRSS